MRAPACDSALAAGAGRLQGQLIWGSVRRLVRVDDEMPQHVGLNMRWMQRMTCFSKGGEGVTVLSGCNLAAGPPSACTPAQAVLSSIGACDRRERIGRCFSGGLARRAVMGRLGLRDS